MQMTQAVNGRNTSRYGQAVSMAAYFHPMRAWQAVEAVETVVIYIEGMTAPTTNICLSDGYICVYMAMMYLCGIDVYISPL